MDDPATGQGVLQAPDAFGGELGGIEVQFAQGFHFRENFNGGIGDGQVVQPKFFELGQFGQGPDRLVRHLRFPKVQAFELGQFGEVGSRLVGDPVCPEAKVGELIRLREVGNSVIGYVGFPNREQLEGFGPGQVTRSLVSDLRSVEVEPFELGEFCNDGHVFVTCGGFLEGEVGEHVGQPRPVAHADVLERELPLGWPRGRHGRRR
mgnify:CR=1 FL=1